MALTQRRGQERGQKHRAEIPLWLNSATQNGTVHTNPQNLRLRFWGEGVFLCDMEDSESFMLILDSVCGL